MEAGRMDDPDYPTMYQRFLMILGNEVHIIFKKKPELDVFKITVFRYIEIK